MNPFMVLICYLHGFVRVMSIGNDGIFPFPLPVSLSAEGMSFPLKLFLDRTVLSIWNLHNGKGRCLIYFKFTHNSFDFNRHKSKIRWKAHQQFLLWKSPNVEVWFSVLKTHFYLQSSVRSILFHYTCSIIQVLQSTHNILVLQGRI